MAIGVAVTAAGTTVYPYVCTRCGTVQHQYARLAVALEWARLNGRLRRVKMDTERKRPELFAKRRAEIANRKCEVCGEGHAQWHHWAPRYLFGSEAEKWPKSLLCQSCHTRWHQRVTPRMSER